MKNLKVELTYAIYSVIAMIVWILFLHFLGFNSTKIEVGDKIQPIIFVVILALLFLGIKKKRGQKLRSDGFSFMEGLKAAFYISLFYAIFQSIWFLIYDNIINPDYIRLTLNLKERQMAAEGKSEAQINDAVKWTKIILDGGVKQFLFFTLSTTIIDTMIGAAMAFFLKRKSTSNVG